MSSSEATLRGVLNPNASGPVEPGTYEFLYKATQTELTAECESAGASKAPVPPGMYLGAEPEEVSQPVTGLTPNTEYVVCLAAENGTGERAIGNAVSFATLAEAPQTEAATAVEATSARLNGTLEPAGAEQRYEFEYDRGASCEGAGSSTTSRAQGKDAVSAVVGGLTPGTEYTFCLIAVNVRGVRTLGAALSFKTPLAAPAIVSEYVTSVHEDDATLHATINPDGLATTYRIEFGPTAAYGCEGEACLEGSLAAGLTAVPVERLVEKLSADTTYHYRVVARNGLGETEGLDHTFTTPEGGRAPGLIDGRGWELVSPPDKRGAALEAITLEGGEIQAAAGGSGLAYIARGPVDAEPAGNRSFAEQQLLATRTGSGWSTQDIATAHEAVAGLLAGELSEYRLFAPDLSAGIVEPAGATPLSPAASERTPYLRSASGEYVPLVTSCPPPGSPCEPAVEALADVPPGTKFGASEEEGILQPFTGVQFAGASPDLAHVVLTAPQSLAEHFETGGEAGLYEWPPSGGRLQPVSVLPGGASAATEGGAELGAEGRLVRNALSVDGSRAFFQTRSEGRLFMRDTLRAESVRLDAPEAGAEGGHGRAVYEGASNDGSRVLFKDTARLTVGATATEDEPDLYMCEVGGSVDERSCAEKGDLTDLSITANAGEAADVLGAVLGYSEDGQYVYFVANGVLGNAGVPVAGAVHGDCVDEEGRAEAELAPRSCNLYVWHDGVTKLAAVLSGADTPDWEASSSNTELTNLTARVSPNGRFLAFMSQRPLTRYDNDDASSGVADEEVFLYDTSSDKVVCASCDPSGARPTGVHDPTSRGEEGPPPLVDRATVWQDRWLAGSIPGWTPEHGGISLYQSRYLSNEGRLFFDSSVGLVPTDDNGEQDVYEFELEGVGNCTSATSSATTTFVREVAGSPVDGCIGLISSGTSGEESAFLDASAAGAGGQEGEDVFFLTAARLVNADVDEALDVYDAHVCSSASPCLSSTVTTTTPCTTADSCRGTPAPQSSVFGAPASATTPGTGNLAPPAPAKAAKPLTRAQKLTKALKACRKKHNRKKRRACERQARKRYGASKPKRSTNKRSGKR